MEATDAADQIRENAGGDADKERFNGIVAVIIALMATLLTIASLGGDNAGQDIGTLNVEVANKWAFYQAKNIRQTAYETAVAEMKLAIAASGASLNSEAKTAAEETMNGFQKKVERYESEPDKSDPENLLKGEGKKQLMEQARDLEKQRAIAMEKDDNFDFAIALFQIAIVLASVAILITSKSLLAISLAIGALASLLTLNGFMLLFALPI